MPEKGGKEAHASAVFTVGLANNQLLQTIDDAVVISPAKHTVLRLLLALQWISSYFIFEDKLS